MTIQEFITRFNQEYDWRHQIITQDFLNTHPFLTSELHDWLAVSKINPNDHEYNISTATVSELKTIKNKFKLKIYHYPSQHNVNFYIQPNFNEKEYKQFFSQQLLEDFSKLQETYSKEHQELTSKLNEIQDISNLLSEPQD